MENLKLKIPRKMSLDEDSTPKVKSPPKTQILKKTLLFNSNRMIFPTTTEHSNINYINIKKSSTL